MGGKIICVISVQLEVPKLFRAPGSRLRLPDGTSTLVPGGWGPLSMAQPLCLCTTATSNRAEKTANKIVEVVDK